MIVDPTEEDPQFRFLALEYSDWLAELFRRDRVQAHDLFDIFGYKKYELGTDNMWTYLTKFCLATCISHDMRIKACINYNQICPPIEDSSADDKSEAKFDATTAIERSQLGPPVLHSSDDEEEYDTEAELEAATVAAIERFNCNQLEPPVLHSSDYEESEAELEAATVAAIERFNCSQLEPPVFKEE
jgi:hypothetical protein